MLSIDQIGVLAAARRIGLDEANDLVNFQKAFIEAKIGTELEQRIGMIETALAKANLNLNLGIAVQGGLPELPVGPDEPTTIMPAKLLPMARQLTELPPNPGDNGGGES